LSRVEPHLENLSFESRVRLTHCTNENRLLQSFETFAFGKLPPHSPATYHDTRMVKLNFAMSNLVSRHFILELLFLTNEHISSLTWRRAEFFIR